jgi:hypothetical protein
MIINERIFNRVKEHYNYLISAGYDVICTCLQGSQNYGLDEYSQEYQSDVDTKSIIAPTLNDVVNASPPISTVEVLDNGEHVEVKDIRVMFEMFKKMNISYIELLYSDYIIINPKWEDYIIDLFGMRDRISALNKNQFLKCIAGMAHEKEKALCHPYPGIIDKIEEYGYDGKQLSHATRLYIFIRKYVKGTPLEKCYKVESKDAKMMLMNLKKQLDVDGNPLSKEDAIKMCQWVVEEIDMIKQMNLLPHDEVDIAAIKELDRIKFNVIKEKMRRELLEEDREAFQTAECAVIQKLGIQIKDNIYDYYEREGK